MKTKDFRKQIPKNIVFERTNNGCPVFRCEICNNRFITLAHARSHLLNKH